MVYLDRHNVNCGGDSFLDAFKLNQHGTNRMRFNADCCRVPDKKSCYAARTTENDDGGGNTVYLDRHNVECRDNYVLSRFRVVRNAAHNKVAYHYTCCTIKEIIPSKNIVLSRASDRFLAPSLAKDVMYSSILRLLGINNVMTTVTRVKV